MSNIKKAEPQILLIFGASGDLTKRKLIPALYDLYIRALLPERFAVLGTGRSVLDSESFKEIARQSIQEFAASEAARVEEFLAHLYYLSFDSSNPEEYELLKNELERLDNIESCSGNILFYMATPPAMYPRISRNLAIAGLASAEGAFRRLIIEKPFGYDLQSAQQLNKSLQEDFPEESLYRIDHYLGKETVQNLLVTRFANGIFEPLWNRNYIDHVEITSAEEIGIGGRGGYYEGAGALRDMLQNHLLLLCSLVAMEPPANMNADSMRNEMVKVLQSLRPLSEDDIHRSVVRGQYTASGKTPAYRHEKDVAPDSRTETFVAMKLFIDNWRWADVPFYIRTGKALAARVTEIVIHFRKTPHPVFSPVPIAEKIASTSMPSRDLNQLVIRIQPDEGILLRFGMKTPGAGFNVQDVNMHFHYSSLGERLLPAAYERLLLDCMLGDATLYSRSDAVEAAWRFIDPLLTAWKENPDVPLYEYVAGTWGPVEADLLKSANRPWRFPCKNLDSEGSYCEL